MVSVTVLARVEENILEAPRHEGEVVRQRHESPNVGRIVRARSAEQSVNQQKTTFGVFIIIWVHNTRGGVRLQSTGRNTVTGIK